MKKITLSIACVDADVDLLEDQMNKSGLPLMGLCCMGIHIEKCNDAETEFVSEAYDVDLNGVDDKDIDRILGENP